MKLSRYGISVRVNVPPLSTPSSFRPKLTGVELAESTDGRSVIRTIPVLMRREDQVISNNNRSKKLNGLG